MEGIDVTDPVPAVEEPEITSTGRTRPGSVEPTTSNGSGGGDGSTTSCPWSLTHEQQVHNLKENCKRAFYWMPKLGDEDAAFETDPWFARVVTNLRLDPWLDSCKFEIHKSRLGQIFPEFDMKSLDVAILMGDLKMVQKILERSDVLHKGIYVPNSCFLACGSMQFEYVLDFLHNCDSTANISILHTPLHLAIEGGDSDIVDVLLKNDVDVNAQNWRGETPLDLVCKRQRGVTMLEQLLQNDTYEGKKPIHVVVPLGDVDFAKKLPSQNVNAMDNNKMTPMHYLATTRFRRFDKLANIVKYLAEDKALDIKALDHYGFSPFYLAILDCNTEVVIALLDSFKDQIRLNEACDKDLGPPIQIAFEGGDSFKDIESALMECDPVKGYMERLYRDRQVYVDAANAILVGAALIASVTFASWLQPPLNYTSYFGEGYSSSDLAPSTSKLNYVDVEHNIALRAFWIFNALSFYFAIATVVCGARSVLPRSQLFIKKTVEKLRINLFVTSTLLACSVVFVIIAFAIAGTIVLTPLLKYQWCMIVPTIVGGIVCTICLGFLVKSIVENYFITHDNGEGFQKDKRDWLKVLGYKV